MGRLPSRSSLNGGYLYEVTTYKPLDTWLADIMKTWQFLN